MKNTTAKREIIGAILGAIIFVTIPPFIGPIETAVPATLIGAGGDWVTREDTGERVCRLNGNLVSNTALTTDFCIDWQIPRLQYGQIIPSEEHGWVRCRWGGCQIHIEGKGWRP